MTFDKAMTSYLEVLDLPPKALDQVAKTFHTFELLCPGSEKLQRLFVTQIYDPSSQTSRIDSLFGFSQSYWFEARDFLSRTDADVSPFKNAITYLGVECFDFVLDEEPNENSRLTVEVQTSGRIYTPLAAVGPNCKELASVVRDILVDNVRHGTMEAAEQK